MKKIFMLIVAILFLLPICAETIAEETTTIYLNTGGYGLWKASEAKFVVWYWGTDETGAASDIMTVVPGDEEVFKTVLPIDEADLDGLKFLRLSDAATSFDGSNWSTSFVWNETSDLTKNGDIFTITLWDGDDGNYSSGSWSADYVAPNSSVAVNYPQYDVVVGQEIEFDVITSDDFISPAISYEVWDSETENFQACDDDMPYTPTENGTCTFRITAREGENIATTEVTINVIDMDIVIQAYRPSNWSNEMYIHYWVNGNTEDNYGPTAMTSMGGGWYSFTYSGSYGDYINVIFVNGSSWSGYNADQTADAENISESVSYVIYNETDTDGKRMLSAISNSGKTLSVNYFYSGCNYLHTWQKYTTEDSYDYPLSGDWPGRTGDISYDGVTWNKVDFTTQFDEAKSNVYVIINNNSDQTSDIDLTNYLYNSGWIADDMEVWVYATGTGTSDYTITLRGDLKTLLENTYYIEAYNGGDNPTMDYGVTYYDDLYATYKTAYETAYSKLGAYASSQDDIDAALADLSAAYSALKKRLHVTINNCKISTNVVVSSILIDADVTLTVADNIEVASDTITLNSDINDVAKVSTSTNSVYATSRLRLTKTVDDAIYYYFSVPFDCAVSDIIAVDAAGNPLENTDYENVWVVREYSESARATNWSSVSSGTRVGWQNVDYGATLKANQGYAIGFGYGGTTTHTDRTSIKSCSFTFEKEVEDAASILLSNTASVDVTATTVALGDDETTTQRGKADLHKGFNLVSVPSYAVYSNSISFTATAAESENKNLPMSVSYPNSDGYGYFQFSTIDASFNFEPFLSFFVQVPEDGTLNFDYDFITDSQPASSAPMLSPSATTSNEDYIVVNLLQNGEVVDKTTAIFVERDMSNYTVGYDLEKMFSSSIPQIYIIDKGYDLAVNGRQFKESDIITLEIYTPSAGEYTLSLASNEYLIEDVNNSEQANSVTFVADGAGYITGEYRVVRQLIATGNSCADTESDDLSIYTQRGSIVVESLNTSSPIYLYTSSGQLVNIYNSSQPTFTISGLYSGIYLLRVENRSYKLVVNN